MTVWNMRKFLRFLLFIVTKISLKTSLKHWTIFFALYSFWKLPSVITQSQLHWGVQRCRKQKKRRNDDLGSQRYKHHVEKTTQGCAVKHYVQTARKSYNLNLDFCLSLKCILEGGVTFCHYMQCWALWTNLHNVSKYNGCELALVFCRL